MNIQIVTSGKPHLSFAHDGISEYIKRANGFNSVELVSIREDKQYEHKLHKVLEGTTVILCDERGKSHDSESFASMIEHYIQQSTKTLSFVIGPADGHSQEIREKYGSSISLSNLTLPHDLATLFLTEAIYRALTIIHGHPYHRS